MFLFHTLLQVGHFSRHQIKIEKTVTGINKTQQLFLFSGAVGFFPPYCLFHIHASTSRELVFLIATIPHMIPK